MKRNQLESWVLSIIDRVADGKKVEDSRVELKAAWPLDMNKVARRIAGHANASGGELILWVIGLDEEKGIVPVQPVELGEWLEQLRKEFDAVVPDFQDLVVPHNGQQVTALLIDTSRAPYVVRNAVFGKEGGGAVKYEVPWRDGTTVRTARREDLIRLLMPLQDLPSVEVLGATVTSVGPLDDGLCWLTLAMYVTPPTSSTVVLPIHRSQLLARAPWIEGDVVFNLTFSTSPFANDTDHKFSREGPSHTIKITSGEAIMIGPGTLYVHAKAEKGFGEDNSNKPLSLVATFRPAGVDKPLTLEVMLQPVHKEIGEEWIFVPSTPFT